MTCHNCRIDCIEGLRHAIRGEFQITTDDFAPYKSAIMNTLEDRCDFAQLIKVHRNPQDGEKRYSPPEVSSVEVVPVMGRPDPERICTSIRAVQSEPENERAAVHQTDQRL